VRFALKVAIVRSEKTQRQISVETAIPETRLSDLVRDRSVPTERERAELIRVLRDPLIFDKEPIGALERRGRQ
jgi:hypothetical protein